ncbi:2-hydroxyacid dehydrogenase [Oryzifoliimicrobium ureilyticus]|uniref:2-hydroxyacid dehydrogenase n=1 Tax=Oryzifoliimicrobium ureilyticus TaxID=3113724 RepID=UPI003F66425B
MNPVPSPVLVDLKFNPERLAALLETAFEDRGSINLADPESRNTDLSSIDYALVWKPDADLFQRATNLKVIFCGGAGVDSILRIPNLPDIPIVRFVDHSLTTRMSEWVVLHCLMHLRGQHAHEKAQRHHQWGDMVPPEAADVTVGIMGMGVLGQDAAMKLTTLGFNVAGWSRSKKAVPGVETYGSEELDAFLHQTDILVGLLPLTAETKGLYNRGLFEKLRHDGALGRPVFLNAGRGGSQVEADIVSAINDGILGGASLDVFEVEPLAPGSPLWDLDNVFITPHDAAVSDEKALFAHVERQIGRFESGQPLEFLVDRRAGY